MDPQQINSKNSRFMMLFELFNSDEKKWLRNAGLVDCLVRRTFAIAYKTNSYGKNITFFILSQTSRFPSLINCEL